MKYRIVIHDYSCAANGGELYTVAINTRQGTIPESIVTLKTRMQLTAIVHGYMHMYNAFEQQIEIHPGCVDTFYKLEIGV